MALVLILIEVGTILQIKRDTKEFPEKKMNLNGWKICEGAALTGLLWTGITIFSCNVPRHSHATQGTSVQPEQMDSGPHTGASAGAGADSLFIEAEHLKLKGDPRGALRAFSEFLLLKPDNATAYYERALLYHALKDPASALSDARRAVSLDSGNHWFAIAYANSLAMNKQFDSAALVFHALSEESPKELKYVYNEAIMLSDAEAYTQALRLFNRLEEQIGINEEFVYQKQRIFLKMGEPDSAAGEIEKLIRTDPENTRYYGLLAQVYADYNQTDKAIRVYRSLLDRYPDNPQAMVALGLFYKKKGDDNAYKRYMSEAFENPRFNINEKIAFVYPYLKYVQIDSSKIPEGLALCRMILAAHPDNAKALALYGDMYYQSGMPDSALKEYRISMAQQDTLYEVWNQMMLVYASSGNNDSLEALSRRAVQKFPYQAGAWYFRGMALYFTGSIQKSTALLWQALKLNIPDKELKCRIYSTLGEAYNRMGQYSTSDSCYRTAIALNPEDDLVLNNYSYHLAERRQDLNQALLMIREAVRIKPGQDLYEDTYAWVLYNMGEYKVAMLWMEKALSRPGATAHPGYLEHYGDILYKNHREGAAVQYWKMARDKGSDSYLLNWKIAKRKLPRPGQLAKHQNRSSTPRR